MLRKFWEFKDNERREKRSISQKNYFDIDWIYKIEFKHGKFSWNSRRKFKKEFKKFNRFYEDGSFQWVSVLKNDHGILKFAQEQRNKQGGAWDGKLRDGKNLAELKNFNNFSYDLFWWW